MALRALALHLHESALASSAATARLAAAAASPGAAYYLEVYASDAVHAAVHASVASAARSTALYAVTCGSAARFFNRMEAEPPRAGVAVLEESLPVTSAAVDRVTASSPSPRSDIAASSPTAPSPPSGAPASSPTAPSSPSASVFLALVASDWVRSSLGPNASAAARPEGQVFSTSSSGVFLPTATTTRVAVSLSRLDPLPSVSTFITGAGARFHGTSVMRYQEGTWFGRSGLRSFASALYSTSSKSAEAPFSEMDIDDLIRQMNKIELNSEKARCFRIAFHNKFYPYWGPPEIGDYLQYQIYNDSEWMHLLRIVYKKAGPHVEAMLIQIREGLQSDYSTADMDPVLHRMEQKFDVLSRKVDSVDVKLMTLMKPFNTKKQKKNWFTIRIFGRDYDTSKIITFLASLLF